MGDGRWPISRRPRALAGSTLKRLSQITTGMGPWTNPSRFPAAEICANSDHFPARPVPKTAGPHPTRGHAIRRSETPLNKKKKKTHTHTHTNPIKRSKSLLLFQDQNLDLAAPRFQIVKMKKKWKDFAAFKRVRTYKRLQAARRKQPRVAIIVLMSSSHCPTHADV
jgi:hypothetical protein